MGSNQSNTAKIVQSITNQIFTDSQEICQGNCTAIQSGNTIVVSGSNVGNLNLTDSCPASASCAMNQQLDAQVEAIMSALAEQTTTTASMFPVSFKFDNDNNSLTIKESITNTITQIMESVCQSTSTNIQDNNVIVYTDSNGGNITLSNAGSANSTCTMNNVARQVAFNQQTAKTNQTAKITSVFTTILIIIVIVIIVCSLLVLLFIGPVGIRNLFGSKSDSSESQNGQGDQSGLIQLLSQKSGGSGAAEGGEAAGGSAAAEGGEAVGGDASLAELALL